MPSLKGLLVKVGFYGIYSRLYMIEAERMMPLQPAGFWRRLAAHMIDGIILAILWMPLYVIFGFDVMFRHPALSLVGFALGMTYYVAFLSSHWQATPGKRLMNVYVVPAEGSGPLSRQRAAVRYIAYLGPTLLIMLMPLLTGATPGVPVGLSEQDQQHFIALHDQMMHFKQLSQEDMNFMAQAERSSQSWLQYLVVIFTQIYMLVLAGTVAWTKKKTGIHDMLCKTQVAKGRPDAALTY